MNRRVTRRCFCTIAVAVLLAGPAVAQTTGPVGSPTDALPGPDAATPDAPNNPFTPPPCTGTVFTDVTCATPFDPWIEQYADDLITGGCGGGLYCPNSPVTRAQMAVFVEKAMRGTATWSPGDRGDQSTALGYSALLDNTTLSGNTAIGSEALRYQSFDPGSPMASGNTAVGRQALYATQPSSPTNGINNTAIGDRALGNNFTGFSNTAMGRHSLLLNSSGFNNTAIGFNAGARIGDEIPGYAGSTVTFSATQSGSYNTFVGISGATVDVSNCTAVGMDAYCDATNQVRLGNFFVTSIGGKVDWSTLSDARAKSDVRDLDLGLPFVLALRPVSYRYKGGNGRADLGFVAQDVETLLGDGYNVVDAGGDADRTLSLRYAELIAPLVKAVQEQQAQIETQRSRIDDQKREIDVLTARLAEVDALRAEVNALARGVGSREIAVARVGMGE